MMMVLIAFCPEPHMCRCGADQDSAGFQQTCSYLDRSTVLLEMFQNIEHQNRIVSFFRQRDIVGQIPELCLDAALHGELDCMLRTVNTDCVISFSQPLKHHATTTSQIGHLVRSSA